MPLVRDVKIDGARLCLWQITESEDDFAKPDKLDLSAMRSPSRRLETLAVYSMLHAVLSRNDIIIDHDENGRPTISGAEISLSHTRGWASLIISEKKRVAVDVEYMSDRVGRIATRFIRPDEQQESLVRQLINWCAKEAVYKYFSEDDLQYFEMRLQPYEMADRGTVMVENLKRGKRLAVNYEVRPEFVLAYAIEA